MKSITLICFFLTIAGAANALTPVFANREAGEYRGKNYVIDIDYERIIALPRWKPESGEPKVSSTEAWKRALAKIKALIPDIEKFETDTISLQQVGSNDGKRFVYVVHFVDWDNYSSKNDFGGGSPNQLSVWVSTEGTVFLPRPSTGKGDEYVF